MQCKTRELCDYARCATPETAAAKSKVSLSVGEEAALWLSPLGSHEGARGGGSASKGRGTHVAQKPKDGAAVARQDGAPLAKGGICARQQIAADAKCTAAQQKWL